MSKELKEIKLDMNNKEHVRVSNNFSKVSGIKTTIVELASVVSEYEDEAWNEAHKVFPDLEKDEEWSYDIKEKKFYMR